MKKERKRNDDWAYCRHPKEKGPNGSSRPIFIKNYWNLKHILFSSLSLSMYPPISYLCPTPTPQTPPGTRGVRPLFFIFLKKYFYYCNYCNYKSEKRKEEKKIRKWNENERLGEVWGQCYRKGGKPKIEGMVGPLTRLNQSPPLKEESNVSWLS